MTTRYRKAGEITAQQWLAAIRELAPDPDHPTFQIKLFVHLGGDPDDHDYARLSFLTKQLRKAGWRIGTSRTKGIWFEGDTPRRPLQPSFDDERPDWAPREVFRCSRCRTIISRLATRGLCGRCV